MLETDDYVLALLLTRLRKLPAERVRACLAAATHDRTRFADALAQAALVPQDELHAFRSAATWLTVGEQIFACTACATQVLGPAEPGALCPRCSRRLATGIVPAPRAVVFDPPLERRTRRMILDLLSRQRTRAQVAEADRLKTAGKVGARKEEVLAPRERACATPVLGPYQLLALAGRGSTSYVYRAEDTRTGRTLALKVLYFREEETEEARAKKLARFQREAELAGRLEHPGLVPSGPLERTDGWYHIPMAFIDGPTLAQVLEARRLGPTRDDPRALVAALCDVARALHYAHTQGVVHRDVNPRNIFFTASGQALLGDFGLAKPVEIASLITGKETLGTLAYISPERLDSEAHADARSDVYSLGVVLFEILTGKPAVKRISEEWLERTLREAATDLAALPPGAVAELVRVVRRAVDPDPARRFPTALDFAHAAAAALDEEAETGSQPAIAPAAAPRASNARVAAIAAVAFLAGALSMSFFLDPAGEGALREVEASFARLQGARDEAEYERARDAVRRALEVAETVVPRAAPALQTWIGRFAWSQGDLQNAEAALARTPARLAHGLAAWLLAQRLHHGPGAEAFAAAATEDFSAVSAHDPQSWDGRLAAAMLAECESRHQDALDPLEKLAQEAPDRATATFLLAWILVRGGRPDQALTRLDALGESPPLDPYLGVCRVVALLNRKVPGDAREPAEATVRLWPDMVEAEMAAARARFERAEVAPARAAIDRALALDPRAFDAWRLRARIFLAAGDPHEAIVALTRVLERDPDAGEYLFQRARLHLRQGDRARGETDLRAYLDRFSGGPRAEEARRLLDER